MKTLIAVPCFDMVHTDFMRCLIDLEKPEGTVYTVIKNTLIYNARNTIAANAVKMGFDRIMWFDSDVTFAPDTLIRLSETMDKTGGEIVSGLYFTRKMPTRPVIFDNLLYQVKEGGVVESGATTAHSIQSALRDHPTHNSGEPIRGIRCARQHEHPPRYR